ncbi:MAG: LLM class F420-dependent oxidoreductase [Candidatus Dormibacteraeota bacterium]|nr:LLM class F420-dependent oxidoreductase [Candidatus Dormibacteraeota bacterium]MBO0743397.1 LLM class F420-dependent oxidoreductase [Candidatus Dormibacteraeota bacterium]
MAFLDLHVPSFTYPGPPEDLFPTVLRIAGAAERGGFNALSVMDHYHQIQPQGSPDEPMLEAYTALGAIAARTSTLRVLTIVTGVTYRSPSILAKQVTTLDVISGGRAILGVGAAWNEEEHRAYGVPFPPIGERMNRLDDAVRICRAMFDHKQSSFEGRYYQTRDAYNVPRPLQSRIPILIGGGGERRTLRLVAEHADLCNIIGDPQTGQHKLEVLRRHCEEVGRDYTTIEKTAHAGIVVIDETEGAVRRRLEAIAAAPPPALRGVSAEELSVRLVSGTPARVTDRLRPYVEAGFDGLSFSVYGAYEEGPVELAGQAGTSALG